MTRTGSAAAGMRPLGLKSVRENFKRPYGARDGSPTFPGAERAGLLSDAPPGRKSQRCRSTTSSETEFSRTL